MALYHTSFFSVLLQVGSCFFFGNCSNAGKHETNESSSQSPETKVEQRTSEDLSEVNRQIYDVLSATQPCSNINACETVAVTLTPREPTQRSIGQRILVIDLGMTVPAYLRYKSRVMDHLVLFEDGSYMSYPKTIQVPRPVFQVLSEILDKQFPNTTAKELNPISDLFYKHKRVLNLNVMHGDEIFSTLADLNPDAEFVIAEIPGVPYEILCSANKDNASFEEYRTFLRNAADSLNSHIAQYDVNYVNMSFGETTQTLKTTWSSQCTNQLFPGDAFFHLLLRTYFEEFYQPLFAANAIFVQAAASSIQELTPVDPGFYCDCQEVPNRIRATGFSSATAHLPMTGFEEPEFLGLAMRGALPCIDLAVNFGVEAKKPYKDGPFPVLMTGDGVGAGSLGTRPSASSAAPIVLSYINYLKQSGLVFGDGADFVSNLKKYHAGRFIEPARYSQFEIYRLGRQ